MFFDRRFGRLLLCFIDIFDHFFANKRGKPYGAVFVTILSIPHTYDII